jgi:antitoxin (DNA-binding transcriptional repressor) of toxin-antitoxin stability system
MKTLTITDAKKNLGRWLAAAARGEDIGIVSGDRRYRRLQRSGKLVTVSADELRKMIEFIFSRPSRRSVRVVPRQPRRSESAVAERQLPVRRPACS